MPKIELSKSEIRVIRALLEMDGAADYVGKNTDEDFEKVFGLARKFENLSRVHEPPSIEKAPCQKCGFGELAHREPFACSDHTYEPSVRCPTCDDGRWATRSHVEARHGGFVPAL